MVVLPITAGFSPSGPKTSFVFRGFGPLSYLLWRLRRLRYYYSHELVEGLGLLLRTTIDSVSQSRVYGVGGSRGKGSQTNWQCDW